MTKPSRIHYHRAQRIYDRLGRGSVADIDAIAQALAEAERGGMKRAASMVCSGCASGTGFGVEGFHRHGSFTFPCHAAAILSEAES